jgi:hypothetical protein
VLLLTNVLSSVRAPPWLTVSGPTAGVVVATETVGVVPVRAAPLAIRLGTFVAASAPWKVTVGLVALDTTLFPLLMVGSALSAAWILACSVVVVALQAIGAVVAPLKVSVNVPPVIVPPKVIVWTVLALTPEAVKAPVTVGVSVLLPSVRVPALTIVPPV